MMPPIMSDGRRDAPIMSDGPHHDGGIIYHCKTPLNIDIYPSTLFFSLEILAISMILMGSGVVPVRVWR